MKLPHPLPAPAKSRQSVRLAILSLSLLLSATPALRAADGAWTLDTNGNWSLSDTAPWAGGIVASGANFTASFNAAGSSARTVTLSGPLAIGHLAFANRNWTLNSSTLTLQTTSGTSLIDVGTGTTTINSILAGDNGLEKTGSGELVLGANTANTYTGGTTIGGGWLRANNNASLGTGAVSVADGARLRLGNGVTLANNITLNGGTSALNQATGTGALSGTVTLQADSGLLMGTGSSITISNTLNLGAHTFTAQTANAAGAYVEIAGSIAGSGGVTKSNAGGILRLSHDNRATWSGTTTAGNGAVEIGHDGALGTGTLNFGGFGTISAIRSTDTTARSLANQVVLTGNTSSTYVFGSAESATNGDLAFTDTTAIALGSTVRNFEVNNRTAFAADFTGTSGGLRQTGPGTLVLEGASTYVGATTVEDGTLLVDGSLHADSVVTVQNGARIGGVGSVGHVTFESGASLVYEVADVGQISGLDALGFTGGGLNGFTLYLTGPGAGFDDNGIYSWSVLTSDSVASISLGAVTLDTSDFVAATGATGGFSLSKAGNSLIVEYSAIPEPSAQALFIGGGLLAFALGRRRRVA